MEAQSEQMQASIETMFFQSESLIYGTGYRLLWWRLPPLTLSRRDWMIGMMWNYKLLLTSTTTTSKVQVQVQDLKARPHKVSTR